MSSDPGTCEATAVTRRQLVGAYLAFVAFVFLFLATFGAWLFLLSVTAGFSTDMPRRMADAVVPVAGWAYGNWPDGTGMWYYRAEVHVIAAGLLGFATVSTATLNLSGAIANARGRRGFLGIRGLKTEVRNLKQQLRQRGHAGLFARRFKVVRVGFPLIAAVVVLASVLLYPTTATDTNGAAYEIHWGLPMWVSAVSSVAAILGCLLMLPFRAEDDVVVDVSGNVHARSERLVVPPQVPQPQAPASA
jgi:hypothetical protein